MSLDLSFMDLLSLFIPSSSSHSFIRLRETALLKPTKRTRYIFFVIFGSLIMVPRGDSRERCDGIVSAASQSFANCGVLR